MFSKDRKMENPSGEDRPTTLQLKAVLAAYEELSQFENFASATVTEVEGKPGILLLVLNLEEAEREGIPNKLRELTDLPYHIERMPTEDDIRRARELE